ncbi:MAG: RnfABCDGE type electron transport complex subunit G [Eubacterium aggregans]|jgi:electron transport complex protein RnfG|uniref:Ion-translocating oxidoreductase complex subunit G n=1 Tax=Eubacterium aggregans TaxID=81409 RepID=A0A1H3ZN33_9FIRM|nr:RnfABCDGE type electron transport complex subunit G [Eubacterium aggregans]MEA5074077.1 RnfABCDGE type electron transport complex subunit G [Eubacterium aggregans]SEA24664.1 electron transport complex protein RnfG [Eubacterium aggregans]
MSDKTKVQIDWKTVGRLALILFIITAVAALLLALTNSVTKDAIAKQTEEKNIEARQMVLPEAVDFEAVPGVEDIAKEAVGDNANIVAEVYAGYKDNQLVGYTVKTVPKGYGGEVETLTGISTDGQVTGITILSNDETAGLGARATETTFQDQYKGLDATQEIAVVKGGGASGNQINAITGATITSKAVTLGVNTSTQIYKAIAGGQK